MPNQSSQNQKDLETLSNAIFDGNATMDALPDNVQAQVLQYWSGPNAQLGDVPTVEEINELAKRRAESTPSLIPKPIEWVGAKLYWLYSNTVSPAISFTAQSINDVINDPFDEKNENISLGEVWDQAKSVSPGQAIWQLGLSDAELKERGISPAQMAQDKKLAEKGFQTRSGEYYSNGFAQFATGATDLAVSWWADPLVLVGKGASAARLATQVRPVAPLMNKAAIKADKLGLGADKTSELFAQTPVFQKMVDTVMDIKVKNPDSAALVMRRDFQTIAKSKDGDVMARLLDQAKDADEVSDILRISMGDVAAHEAVRVKNAVLGAQLDTLRQNVKAFGTHYAGMTPAQQAGPRGRMIKDYLDRETRNIQGIERQSLIISDKIKAFNAVDNMHFNGVTTPLGLRIRGSEAARGSTALKPMRGQGVIKATSNLVYNTSVGFPIKVIRSYNDIKPTAYIDIHAEDAYKNLDATLREAPMIDRATRERMVSSFIRSSAADRGLKLIQVETEVVANMVNKYNRGKAPADQISHEMAMDLYRDFATRRRQGQAATTQGGRAYGSARIPDPSNPGMTINVAEVDDVGGRLVTTPIFETQLANSHVMLDFKTFQRMLNEQGSNFQKTWNAAKDKGAWVVDMADTLGTYWKFAQLFRLGYGPRALADDYLGQLARYGGIAALERAVTGGRVKIEDVLRNRMAPDSVEMARTRQGILQGEIDTLTKRQGDLFANIARERHAGGPKVAKYERAAGHVADQLRFRNDEMTELSKITAEGSQMRGLKLGRQSFEGGYRGSEGQLFKDLASGQTNLQRLLGSESDLVLKQARSMDWTNIDVTTHGATRHMDAWMRKITQQIAQSAVGRAALSGMDETQLVNWMRSSPEGIRYRHDIGLKNITDLELARRIKAEVDYTLDPSNPLLTGVRQAALDGTLTADMLKVVPSRARPMVNAQSYSYAIGDNPLSTALDGMITKYFNLVNQIPAQRLLRNPLFGQQYKADLAAQMATLRAQGVTHVDEATRKIMENQARKAAVRDVKRYTFTMDHETKMAYTMRHFAAFFGAQQESWNRWARIISEKPQALAHVAQVYGAPSRAGLTVDQDGNAVDAAGYRTNPVTGQRELVPYNERKMLIQIPEYLGGKEIKKGLGLDPDAALTVPLSSAELVLNSGDGVMPVGAGPYLQIATNHFAQDNPGVADWSKKLGVLPFGPQDSVMDFINPTTGKRLGDSADDMGEAKQRNLFYMMQVENYKWENGLRDTQPTWDELKDRADRWSIARTAFAFGLPLSVNAQDPYQFFRDEYQRFQKLDPNSADQKFYDKYGDSYYLFTQSMSKNSTGLRPTAEGVKMSKYYQDLVNQVGPEYAGLIVGDEGDGKYSEGAYFYQKTHSTDVAGGSPDRSSMSAREAWEEGQIALGWKQFNKANEKLYAELFEQGFQSFNDEGAEMLKAKRDANIQLMSTATFPDNGEDNPYYNEAWTKAYNSIDKSKYDRQAADIWKIINDPELWAKAQLEDGTVGARSDLYTVRGYLEQRREFQKALLIRDANGGSDDPTAQSNADLKDSWDRMVMDLIQKDTKFAWLHSRWFSGDMGFNRRVAENEEETSG
jgi:hypothetical protein